MAPPALRSTLFDGIKVSYTSHGTGSSALIFIHGWTCTSELWHAQSPLFHRHRSLLIDLPGHGASDAPPGIEYSQDLFARAVHSVLNQEGITSAVLIGHSMGGPVSTMTLRLFPNLISAIIYVDSFFRLPEHYLAGPERHALAARHSSDEKFSSLIDRFFTARTTPESRALIKKTMLSTLRHVRTNATTTDSMPHAFRWDEVYGIPALHIVTPMFAKQVDGAWYRHLPRLEMRVWEGNGHFLFLEDPGAFNACVERFLGENGLMEQRKGS